MPNTHTHTHTHTFIIYYIIHFVFKANLTNNHISFQMNMTPREEVMCDIGWPNPLCWWWCHQLVKKRKEALFCYFSSSPRNETLTENRGHKLWWTEWSFSFMGSHGVSASRCQSSSSASTEPSSDGGGSKTINQLQYINYFWSKVGPSC